MKGVKHRLLKAGDIDRTLRTEMFRLLDRYYTDVSFDKFCSDLEEKDHVFSFWFGKQLIGFSTVLRKRTEAPLKAVLIFSGDTVIDEDFWGGKFLQAAFSRYLLKTKRENPFRPVYWMLISKGYKTYLMMRRNFPVSFPNPDDEIPEHIKGVMDDYYALKFGQAYIRKPGLIQSDGVGGAVKGNLAVPSKEALKDPDISHFVASNPNYKRGDELACAALIRIRDLVALVPKYLLGKKR